VSNPKKQARRRSSRCRGRKEVREGGRIDERVQLKEAQKKEGSLPREGGREGGREGLTKGSDPKRPRRRRSRCRGREGGREGGRD